MSYTFSEVFLMRAKRAATFLITFLAFSSVIHPSKDAISKKFDEVRAAKEAERAAKKAANPNKDGKHGKGHKAPRP